MIRFLDRQARFIFPGPAILALIILYAAPISYTLYLSLYRWDLSPIHPPVPVGLANYAQLLGDHRFFRAILNTLYYCALALPAQLVIGIAIALLLNRKFHGRGVTLAIFLFPTMATPIASLIGWRMLLAPDVGLFGLLTGLGIPPIALLANDTLLIPTMTVVDTWQWTPFVTLILLGGLAALPPEPFEAAVVDGAGRWQLFRYITLPLLRPFIVVAMLFRLIDTLKVFDVVFVLTQGGAGANAETLNIYAYREGFEYFDMGYSSALLFVFFLIVFGVALILIYLRRATL